jgi:MFS family permease
MFYQWLVVGLTMVMQAVSYGILVYSFGLFVVPWLTEFDSSRADVMLAVFVLQICMGPLSPIAGRLLDKYDPRWLVCLGGFLLASGLILISFTTSMWQLILLYATVIPVAITLSGPLASQTIVTKWFREKRGLAIGISAIGTSVGGFLLPVLAGSLLAAFDWRITMQILGLLAFLLISPAAWLVLKRRPPSAPAPDLSATAPETTQTEHLTSPDERSWTTKEILSTRNFWLPVIALLPLAGVFGGIQFNLSAYAQDLNNSVQDSAWLISLMSLTMILGKIFFGYMADRMDHRKLYWIAAVLMCMTLFLLLGNPAYLVLCLASALLGLSAGGILPLMGSIYSERFGAKSFGRVMGLVTMFITLGGFGPLIAGAVFDATGDYDAAFYTFLAILIPAALGMIWLKNGTKGKAAA